MLKAKIRISTKSVLKDEIKKCCHIQAFKAEMVEIKAC